METKESKGVCLRGVPHFFFKKLLFELALIIAVTVTVGCIFCFFFWWELSFAWCLLVMCVMVVVHLVCCDVS